MVAVRSLEDRKRKLVSELESRRKSTLMPGGKPLTKRALSLAVCDNGSYYTHLINHPTSFPSSARLEELNEAMDKYQRAYEFLSEGGVAEGAAVLEGVG